MKIFLGGPFGALLRDDGLVGATDRQRIESWIDILEEAGYDVFSAHRSEAWGARLLPPRECVAADWAEVLTADAIVFLPGASPGSLVEIGWATALGINPIILHDHSYDLPAMVVGLIESQRAFLVEDDNHARSNVLTLLSSAQSDRG